MSRAPIERRTLSPARAAGQESSVRAAPGHGKVVDGGCPSRIPGCRVQLGAMRSSTSWARCPFSNKSPFGALAPVFLLSAYSPMLATTPSVGQLTVSGASRVEMTSQTRAAAVRGKWTTWKRS